MFEYKKYDEDGIVLYGIALFRTILIWFGIGGTFHALPLVQIEKWSIMVMWLDLMFCVEVADN